jgi:hypothetical protein
MVDQLEQLQCCDCGTFFGMQASLVAMRRKDHREFRCPNGHAQIFAAPKVDPDAERIAKLEADITTLRKRDDLLTAWVKRAPHLATCNVHADRPCDCGRGGRSAATRAPDAARG